MTQEVFKILSDKEHILLRSGMYIGSTNKETYTQFVSGVYRQIEFVPGLIKIINEIIDNSLDEAIRTNFKYANIIGVDIRENEITVSDNGRGIPQDKVMDPTGKELLRPEAAWTRTKAGSNFSDDRTTVGMNGVGSALTNYFSMRFIGETCDGNNTVIVKCSNNADRVFVSTKSGGTRGTRVSFVPDFTRFGVFGISPSDCEIVYDRLESLAVAFPEITFKYNGKKIQGGLKRYSELFKAHITHEAGNVSFFIGGGVDEFRHTSFVNGVQTVNGGTHVDYFVNQLCDSIIPLVKKKHKVEVSKTTLKNGLLVGLFIRGFNNPKFDSQTKERLTNSQAEISPYLKDIQYDAIAKKVVACDEIISPIIDTLLAKLAAEEARELKKQQKQVAKKRVDGHIKCNGNSGTLFLTEGKSAIGYLLKVRDSNKHGGYPLRGKVLNTWGMKPTEILKNNELSDIISILGLTLGDKDISGMEYKEIAILTDADVDGRGSIYPLLLAFFYHWPELYKQGKVKFCKTPIIIASKGKSTKWFYSLTDFDSIKYNEWKVRYIKGLGSLTEQEYRQVINDPQMDVVTIDDVKCFDIMFGNDAEQRKRWMT